MSDRSISRRKFLRDGSIYGGSFWIAMNVPRPKASADALASSDPVMLDPTQWKTLEAITARILPTDHEPGAVEAGCVNFIDKALANEDAAALPLYQTGLAGVDAEARDRWGAAFVELHPAQQDAVLLAVEAGATPAWPDGPIPSPLFFETVRAHTIIGFLADPKYGGNRDFAGWRVTGYPGPRHHLGGYTSAQMLGRAKINTVWGEEI